MHPLVSPHAASSMLLISYHFFNALGTVGGVSCGAVRVRGPNFVCCAFIVARAIVVWLMWRRLCLLPLTSTRDVSSYVVSWFSGMTTGDGRGGAIRRR
ncbi:hypothetical protein MXD62_07680 [Frankia sp. Mgl5]|uniref:hypothetical protein n=1 Tax=Frankia sp. Mgl5 TaxID=2933793 RepID=UPI00201035F6|nr:hypothetical protein [Frankia sp. Mgl5]MCK9927045.1 hypothetical protein [Frankia sp. Mgl5]